MKSLIAFYSRRGENYIDGAVKTLTVGNTELAAAELQKLTGADCFQIEPCQDYPADYYQCIDLACQDLRKGIRPKLKRLPDVSQRMVSGFLSAAQFDYGICFRRFVGQGAGNRQYSFSEKRKFSA